MHDSSTCADSECDLLAVANNLMSDFVASIQCVRRMTGKNVFICWRCAEEWYQARHMRACWNHNHAQADFCVSGNV